MKNHVFLIDWLTDWLTDWLNDQFKWGLTSQSESTLLKLCWDIAFVGLLSHLDKSWTQVQLTGSGIKPFSKFLPALQQRHQVAHLNLQDPVMSIWKAYIIWAMLTRKPVFRVSDQVRLKLACSATEASMRLEILVTETWDITLSRQETTKALIRLRGCAGWSAPLLFAYDIRHVFSWPGSCIFGKHT